MTLLDRRTVVLGAVHAVPGSHLRALERISGLALGTVRHHVGVLVRQRDVALERDRRFRRYYPFAMPGSDRRVWDALRLRQTRDIVKRLLDGPANPSDLARSLDAAYSTIHLHGRRLRALGVVEDRAGLLALRAPEVVRAILAAINPTRLDLLTDGAVGLFDDLEPR